MSLRFGSGWLVIYFLICSCTFICSAPPVRARDYTTLNPSPPLQGRAALTVEVTRPRGRPASRCCVGAFQNSQRLEVCGAPRSGQRGWSTCTPSRVHIPDVLSAILSATWKAAENDCLVVNFRWCIVCIGDSKDACSPPEVVISHPGVAYRSD